MKIAVDIGGNRARRMVERELRTLDAIETACFDGGSIAVAGASLVRRDDDLFVTIGSPVRSAKPDDIIDSRAAVRLLTAQDGAFASIFWSARERKLIVVTDFVGFKPLYMLREPGAFQIASDTKAWNRTPDPAGWGAFVSFGHTIGDRTLMEGVQRVPPGTALTYDVATDGLTEHRYWSWPPRIEKPNIGAIAEALQESVRAYAHDYGGQGTLLLSGGFDSRLIACLLGRAGLLGQALSVSHPEELRDADARFATAFARKQRIALEFLQSPPDFFQARGIWNTCSIAMQPHRASISLFRRFRSS